MPQRTMETHLTIMTTTAEIVYECGCEAGGNNVASFCPMHGNPIARDGSTMITTAEKIKALEARLELLRQDIANIACKDIKLDMQHKHVMRYIQRDREENGWAPVSEDLYPALSENMPPELIEFEKHDIGGQARLTPKGEQILDVLKKAKDDD